MLKNALYKLITNIYSFDECYIYNYIEIYNCISISFHSTDSNLNIKPFSDYLESVGLNKYFSVNLIQQCLYNTLIPNGRNAEGEFIHIPMKVYSYRVDIEKKTNTDIDIILGYFKLLHII